MVKTFYGLSVVYFSPTQSAVRNHISQIAMTKKSEYSKSLNCSPLSAITTAVFLTHAAAVRPAHALVITLLAPMSAVMAPIPEYMITSAI